jgi:hypothetical protein
LLIAECISLHYVFPHSQPSEIFYEKQSHSVCPVWPRSSLTTCSERVWPARPDRHSTYDVLNKESALSVRSYGDPIQKTTFITVRWTKSLDLGRPYASPSNTSMPMKRMLYVELACCHMHLLLDGSCTEPTSLLPVKHFWLWYGALWESDQICVLHELASCFVPHWSRSWQLMRVYIFRYLRCCICQWLSYSCPPGGLDLGGQKSTDHQAHICMAHISAISVKTTQACFTRVLYTHFSRALSMDWFVHVLKLHVSSQHIFSSCSWY